MAKALALLALAALLVSGCSSGPGEDPATDVATTTPTVTTSVGAGPAVPRLTDTLHFLAHPSLTQQPPDDYSELRIPIPVFAAGLAQSATGGAARQMWSYELPQDLAGVVGNVTFWVEVKGTVLNNPNPLVGGCFWEFRMIVDPDAVDGAKYAPCVPEGSTVAPGVRAVTFPFDFPGVSLTAGQAVQFDFYTQDFGRDPDASVDLLTYSIDHDSRLHLVGLQVPLDGSLLLQASA